MGKYVTIEYLKEHSRLKYADCTDEYLDLLLGAAEEKVKADLQVESLDGFCDDRGALAPDIKVAVLQVAAAFYENREATKPVQTYANPAYEGIIRKRRRYIGQETEDISGTANS